MDLNFINNLVKQNNSKIVLLVMDGLGGLPLDENGQTELESAKTPNLDRLSKKSICGLQIPVGNSITPGSGPGHLGLFGYNPIKYQVGRGVLAATGIGFDLKPGDIAARGNFATIDEDGNVTDRRAGRIPSEKNKELCELLCEKIDIPGVDVFIETVKEYRFLLVLRGKDLKSNIFDTDPQQLGVQPLKAKPTNPDSVNTADIVNEFLRQAKYILKDQKPANMVLLRGFSEKPDWPRFPEVFGLKSAAIASYPMYRGLAGLIGMDNLEIKEGSIEEEFNVLKNNWKKYDFFFVHIKKTDSYGEDGNFDSKVKIIEQVDSMIPLLLDLNPDVILITGDHSTPSLLKYHSWHPVPVLLYLSLIHI